MGQLFYSGTSGLNLPFSKKEYPPAFKEKSLLQYYASLFNSIEVNSIFYKLPKASTVENWAENVPENFRFTFKVSKTITHVKGLQFVKKDVDDFMRIVNVVEEKKGCLLVQFPPSLKIDFLNELQNLLETLGEATFKTTWKIAVEFRDPSWYEREVNELLDEYDAIRVIHDIPKSATPLINIKSDVVYVRFHGPEPRYRGSYNDAFLKKYAQNIHNWLLEKKTVYVYFNNTAGAAFENLQTLNRLISL